MIPMQAVGREPQMKVNRLHQGKQSQIYNRCWEGRWSSVTFFFSLCLWILFYFFEAKEGCNHGLLSLNILSMGLGTMDLFAALRNCSQEEGQCLSEAMLIKTHLLKIWNWASNQAVPTNTGAEHQ
jgi:hypothetical protein